MRPRPPCCGCRRTPAQGWALASSGRPSLHPGWPRHGAPGLSPLLYSYTCGLFMRMENAVRARRSVWLWRMFCRSNATFVFIFLKTGLEVSDTPRPRLGLRRCRWAVPLGHATGTRWDTLGPSVVFGHGAPAVLQVPSLVLVGPDILSSLPKGGVRCSGWGDRSLPVGEGGPRFAFQWVFINPLLQAHVGRDFSRLR